jgi:S1-C subfamily serine protease
VRIRALVALAFVAALAGPAWAQDDPAAGTVYIRVIGDVRVLTSGENRMRQEKVVDIPRLELQTGSGVIVSALGLVITNNHVVETHKTEIVVDGQKLEVEIDVRGIEVVLPRQGAGGEPARYSASVYAADPGLDIAILSIAATDLPFVGLGDSDAIAAGDAVRAIGYPLGDKLEIGKAPAASPEASMTTGTISAFRRDDQGEVKFLQTSAALNPGNSGGPLVDADGNVVGIAQSVLRGATSVGFAIPINVVKQFMRSRGLDTNLPAPLLSLGPYIEPADRGVKLRIPEGYREDSPNRLRVEASSLEGTPALHIDRIAAAGSLDQIEAALLNGGTLERFAAPGQPRRIKLAERQVRRAIVGWSFGEDPATRADLSMVYLIVDGGREKLIARYVGSRYAIAMNRSVLQQSLMGMDVTALLTAELSRAVTTEFSATNVMVVGPTVPAPTGWVIEGGGPSACAGLPPPPSGASMSPKGDFTVQLRVAWWPGSLPDAAKLARACGAAGSLGENSYVLQGQWWGEPYEARGAFVANGSSGFWHFELIAPAKKTGYVSALFERWIAATTRK